MEDKLIKTEALVKRNQKITFSYYKHFVVIEHTDRKKKNFKTTRQMDKKTAYRYQGDLFMLGFRSL